MKKIIFLALILTISFTVSATESDQKDKPNVQPATSTVCSPFPACEVEQEQAAAAYQAFLETLLPGILFNGSVEPVLESTEEEPDAT